MIISEQQKHINAITKQTSVHKIQNRFMGQNDSKWQSRSHTVCLKVSKVTRKQLDRWFWALLLYFSDTYCCPHWGPLGYTSSYTPPALSSASTRQHPENKGWWGTDEGIQCSLEEVLLLKVAKIWASVSFGFGSLIALHFVYECQKLDCLKISELNMLW